MLGADLKLEQRMEDTIKELVRTGGGDVTREIDRADIFICHTERERSMSSHRKLEKMSAI